MATPTLRLPDNAPGPFYVDSSCIDCDTCRRVAPETFAPGRGHSYVARQPGEDAARRRALMALVACPTGSIGAEPKADARPGVAAFPERVAPGVSFCGFTSERSFGAWSWLIERPGGNVLVDSPRAAGPLMSALEARGGIATMFLTHRDDVADHETFARRFGCTRVLHERDVTRSTATVERRLVGEEPAALAPDLIAIPTPGHTPGHAVLLWNETYLFTGDHLAYSRRRQGLIAFRDACWHSWSEQVQSMERLLDFRFEWVLPGHGSLWQARSAAHMRRELEKCVRWMREVDR